MNWEFLSFTVVIAFWHGPLAVMGDWSKPAERVSARAFWDLLGIRKVIIIHDHRNDRSLFESTNEIARYDPLSWPCQLFGGLKEIPSVLVTTIHIPSNTKLVHVHCLNRVFEAFFFKFSFVRSNLACKNLRLWIISPNEIVNASRSFRVTATVCTNMVLVWLHIQRRIK